jgi:steroid 5-alpha reductase family enzyme
LATSQHEDGRYVKMRNEWGKRVDYKMFEFYMIQALILAVLLTPIASSFIHEEKSLLLIHKIGIGVVIVALLGELIADWQLREFKESEPRNKVCEVGLWAWTRHPNYFFEWLIWVGFALLSYNDSYYAVPGIFCAFLMFYLLNKVSGIPMTEEHLLTSKGEAYKRYQEKVPAFWPRKPKA